MESTPLPNCKPQLFLIAFFFFDTWFRYCLFQCVHRATLIMVDAVIFVSWLHFLKATAVLALLASTYNQMAEHVYLVGLLSYVVLLVPGRE